MSKKEKSKDRTLDKFYTNRKIIPELLEKLNLFLEDKGLLDNLMWLEPSAGDGAFLDFMPEGSIGLDLLPQREDIITQDFLLWNPLDLSKQPPSCQDARWIVFGNPPFGKNSSLAISFFNHCASFSEVIAFILPRTFEKVGIQNRLNLNFELISQTPIKENSFLFQGKEVCVPCVFQIWSKNTSSPRVKIITDKHHIDFERVSNPKDADFAFQRVGVQAGRVKDMSYPHISPSSHHFIKVKDRDRDNIKKVRDKISSLDFSKVKYSTAGNPSIGLSELIALYKQA